MEKEEGFFFENEGQALYGFYHPPGGESRRFGFAFCSPFIEEKVRSQRMMVNFARRLADAGYAVLRFDYRGYGDSQGEFEEATPARQISDTLRALAILRERAAPCGTGILGARLGATLAVLASLRDRGVTRLILWDPIVDVRAYLYRCLRANLSSQTIRHKKILYNREKLIEMIRNGEKVNLDGYLIARSFFEEAEGIDLLVEAERIEAKVLTLRLAARELDPAPSLEDFHQRLAVGTSSTLETAADNFSWEGQRYYNPAPAELFARTLEWVLACCP